MKINNSNNYTKYIALANTSLTSTGLKHKIILREAIKKKENIYGHCSAPTMDRFSRPWSDIRHFFQKSLIFVKITTFRAS